MMSGNSFFLQANMYVAEKTVNIVCRVTSSVRLKVGVIFYPA